MCGRYALSLRPSIVRQRLADQHMYVDEGAEDDDDRIRQTYNFAPGYHGLIYRAARSNSQEQDGEDQEAHDDGPARKRQKTSNTDSHTVDGRATKGTKYKLQAAKWGLIPFWTKRSPDYASQMKTINCRDDSLLENRGMWNTMKQRKRCVVVAQGFYEWLKKNNGKEKIPHFVKRKDGELMCFAGLWDMVQYEGSDEQLYTYTIITTDSNSQLKFLHDRMPVILEAGSEAMKTWLDPERQEWSKDLQSLLKPFSGELDCYPVDQGVGKVGNNSPLFVIPVDSKENKKNIANFFGNQVAKSSPVKKEEVNQQKTVKKEDEDDRVTTDKIESTEDNAPLPKPQSEADDDLQAAIIKSEQLEDEADKSKPNDVASDEAPGTTDSKHSAHSPAKKKQNSKQQTQSSIRKARNATSNMTVAKSPEKAGNAKITSFFGK